MKYKKIVFIGLSVTLGTLALFCAVKKPGNLIPVPPGGNETPENPENPENGGEPGGGEVVLNGCQYSDDPKHEDCVNCSLKLVCMSPDKYGRIIEYEGKNENGSVVTQIPTTTCDQEGYWSCPAIPFVLTTGNPPALPPQLCPAIITQTPLLAWPTYMVVKNKKAIEYLAVRACKKGAPSNALEMYDFGLRSEKDLKPGQRIDGMIVPSWQPNSIHHILSTDKKPEGDLPFNRLVAFGDSITDTANRYVFMGHPGSYDNFFYHRYSNGPVWVEYISRKFRNTKNEIELMDVAIAGSAVVPGLGDQYMILGYQVDYLTKMFNPNNQPYDSKITATNTIFALMAGMIDFRDVIEDFWHSVDSTRPGSHYYTDRLKKCWDEGKFPGYPKNNSEIEATAKQCVSKVLLDENNSIRAAALKLIKDDHARYFIIPELPDFTLLPRFNAVYKSGTSKPKIPPEAVNVFMHTLANEFNSQLTTRLIPELEGSYNAKVIKLDLHEMYQKLADTNSEIAKAANITYVTSPGQEAPRGTDLGSVLYWDDVHPSDTANCTIAERTYELMYQKFNKVYTPDYSKCHHSYMNPNPATRQQRKETDRKYIR